MLDSRLMEEESHHDMEAAGVRVTILLLSGVLDSEQWRGNNEKLCIVYDRPLYQIRSEHIGACFHGMCGGNTGLTLWR